MSSQAERQRPTSSRRARGQSRAESRGESRTGPIRGGRSGAKRSLLGVIKDLPNFLRLLYGLLTDGRVATSDKLLVAAAIGYILMPMDFIPDFIPFIGEVDDVFVLMTALQRLITNAGRSVLLEHWMGSPEELRSLDLQAVLASAAFFLPRRMRRRLRAIGRV